MLLCIYVYYKCCVRNINYYCVFVFNFSVVLIRIINYYCFFLCECSFIRNILHNCTRCYVFVLFK